MLKLCFFNFFKNFFVKNCTFLKLFVKILPGYSSRIFRNCAIFYLLSLPFCISFRHLSFSSRFFEAEISPYSDAVHLEGLEMLPSDKAADKGGGGKSFHRRPI